MKKKSRAKKLTSALASMGRHGDTMLAHVNPREAALLRALGGSGTRNPRSGLPEFFDSDMGGNDYGGRDGFGGSMGEAQGPNQDGSTLGGGGWGDPGELQGPVTPEHPLGGITERPGGLTGEFGERQGPVTPEHPLDGITERPGGLTGEFGELQGPVTPEHPLDGITERPGGLREGFGGWLDRGFSKLSEELDPNSQRGLFNLAFAMAPTGFTLGARGAYALAEALGDYVGQPLNDAFGGNAKAMDLDYGNSARFGGDQFAGIDMGPSESQRDLINAMMGGIPAAAPAKGPAPSSGSRVSPGGVPDEIASLIGPGMTDLQQRALISTYGTQGVNSAFKADPVKRYYARLLNNAMLDEKSAPVAEPYTLPIEHLYWQGVLGRPVEDPGKTSQVLDAIRAYL